MSSEATAQAPSRTASLSDEAAALLAENDRIVATGKLGAAYDAVQGQLSDVIVRAVRLYIGYDFEDGGRKAVEQAYEKMEDAVLCPDTADGRAVRRPEPGMFLTVVHRRAQDAMRTAGTARLNAQAAEQRASVQDDADRRFERTMVRRLTIEDVKATLPPRIRTFMDMLANGESRRTIAETYGVTERAVGYWLEGLRRIDALRDLL